MTRRVAQDQVSPNLMPMSEAAPLLGISVDTGYRLARAGNFPGNAAVRIGARWWVSRPRFERWLNGEDWAPLAGRDDGSASGTQ